MRLLVVFLARHKLALKVFEEEGLNLLSPNWIPSELSNNVSFVTSAFDPARANKLSFEQHILRCGGVLEASGALNADGLVVLYEDTLGYLLRDVRNAAFAGEIPAIGYVQNIRNYLIQEFSILIRNYGFYLSLIQSATSYQAASLPIRNFNSKEFRDFIEVCRTRTKDRTFQNVICPSLNRVLKLRGPKRRSNYPDVYFKDSEDRYFKYGHEHHSKYETGQPHHDSCLINGSLRFGCTLDQERHYNVTIGDSDKEERITCELPNCHNEPVPVKNRTHLNMFSNDFHK